LLQHLATDPFGLAAIGIQEAGMSETNGNKDITDSTDRQVSLTQMRAGQRGRIVRIIGGRGLVCKLEALGIREGEEIKKVSEQWLRGPVLLRHGHSQVALGFRMAAKVFVKIVGGKR
jgi:ferrous iron transport protein A